MINQHKLTFLPLQSVDIILSAGDLSPNDALGLDHVDKSGRNNRIGAEKAIFIRG